jgi:tetratricopeptide (TPR) repeat protein
MELPAPESPMPKLSLSRLCLALFALVLAAGPAWAKDVRPVEIPLTNGKSLTGVVESAAEGEIVLRMGPEQVRRIPWSRLAPLGLYRAKHALAPAADGDARLQLARLAASLGLYVQAREEYEKALALGAISRKKFKSVVADAEEEAVRNGVNHAERLAEAGDLESAMETARQLQVHFATAPNAKAIQKLIAHLVASVREMDKDAAREKAELERVVVESKRNKEILERRMRAKDLVENALSNKDEWEAARKKGATSRVRKTATAMDKKMQDARRNLGRLRRILPRDHPQRKEILAQLNELDTTQFELRFKTAEFFSESRVYGPAREWAALASYIDPVHPDLVEMRDDLARATIQYRVSDTSNAHGRTSGP